MSPLAAPKTFFLSTLWGITATSSGVPVLAATGKIWDVWTLIRNDWVV